MSVRDPEVWTCDRCDFRYESPRPLTAPPIHPCPSPTSTNRRPMINKNETAGQAVT